MRKGDIAIRPLLAMRRLVRAVNRLAGAGFLILARLILLRKEHVEANRGHVCLRQHLDQRRHRLARPRPATDFRDQFVVDVHDSNRLIERVGSRTPPLVLVEDEVLQVGTQRRNQRSEGQCEDIGQSDYQQVEPPLPPVAQTRSYRAKRHQIENRIRRSMVVRRSPKTRHASRTSGRVNFHDVSQGLPQNSTAQSLQQSMTVPGRR